MTSKSTDPVPSIFILCDKCHWCATYFDKKRLPEMCPQCINYALSSFPILSDESFTFNYSDRRGVELDFNKRKVHRDKTKHL